MNSRLLRRHLALVSILLGGSIVFTPPAHAQAPDLREREPQTADRRADTRGGSAPRGRNETRAGGLSGMARWGEAGTIRVLLTAWPLPGDKDDLLMTVRLINEGDVDFVIEGTDIWSVITEKGRRIPATRVVQIPGHGEADMSKTVPPHSSAQLDLRLSDHLRSPVAAVEYQSSYLQRIIQVRAPYLAPIVRTMVPPVIPEAALEAGGGGKVYASILVGPSGKAEKVFILSPGETEDTYGLRQAVENAVKQWVFDPALQSKDVEQGLVEETFDFAGRVAARGEFKFPPIEAALRLPTVLEESYAGVIPLPRANGFIVSEAPDLNGDNSSIRALLVRFGEAAQPKTTWITASELVLQTRASSAGCSCVDWRVGPGSPRDVLMKIAADLKVNPDPLVTLALQDDQLIPSGSPEPAAQGRWRRDTVRAYLENILQASKATAAGGAATAAPLNLKESDFIDTPEPLSVAGDVTPPKLVARVPPAYPEEALRKKVEGKVILEAVISRNGEPSEIRVLQGDPLLHRSAIDALCCWRYEPALQRGKAVPVYLTVVMDYSLSKP